jgi:branched-chain amino acid transport system substrate-binding protein
MKEKSSLEMVFLALLVVTAFAALPTKAAFKGTITIGIIGPVGSPYWDPNGMKPAAEMAADEINAAGGVALADGNYQIVLKFGDETAYPSADPAAAESEVERLIAVEGCEYLIGGFDPGCTGAMIEKAMDYEIPFFISGANNDELMSLTVNKTDPALYARYTYLFRVNNFNATTIFRTTTDAAQTLIAKLLPLYGHIMYSNVVQVKVAVVVENLSWSQRLFAALTNPAYYPSYLGPNANVTYAGRIPIGTTDFTPWLQGVEDSEARLLIHVFTVSMGELFIAQWRSMNVLALPLGMNPLGLLQTYWDTTQGDCEYESMLSSFGTRTPLVPGVTTVFWDRFVDKTGVWPIYTALGAHNAVNVLLDGLRGVGSSDKDALVAYFENPTYEFPVLNGKFKFDSSHDVFCPESGSNWTQGHVRLMIVQWRAGRTEVVYPVDQTYSTKWAIPPWMYPLQTDISYDGRVDILDIARAARAFVTRPGDPRWDKEADLNFDNAINIIDISMIGRDWGMAVTLPLP